MFQSCVFKLHADVRTLFVISPATFTVCISDEKRRNSVSPPPVAIVVTATVSNGNCSV